MERYIMRWCAASTYLSPPRCGYIVGGGGIDSIWISRVVLSDRAPQHVGWSWPLDAYSVDSDSGGSPGRPRRTP